MVLVTGASGFIGSHLVERLVRDRIRVRCLVRRQSRLHDLPVSSVELAYGDLASGAGLEQAAQGIQTVIHLAGVTKARSADGYWTGNARGTENLVQACAGVERFVHVSSLAAVGPCEEGSAVSEDTAPHPLTHYGRSKLESERVVRASELGPRAVVVRPPVVFGPRDRDVFQVFRAASRGWLVAIGNQPRWFSWIYVSDLVEGLLAAMSALAAAGRTYFLAHPEPVSWTEFGSTALELMGRSGRRLALPRAAAYLVGLCGEAWSLASGRTSILSREKIAEARCARWTCRTDRASQELGFRARFPLREAMAETLAWYKEAGWLKY